MRSIGRVLAGLVVSMSMVTLSPATAGSPNAGQNTAMPITQMLKESYSDGQVLSTINSVSTAILTMNAYVEYKAPDHPRVICIPQNLALTADQTRDILERFVQRHPEHGTKSSGLLDMVLIYAFVDTFPCK
jgi:hypothetical protein